MDLSKGPRLVPGEAAAALLVTRDGRYLLQHRDALDFIFFPDWWGCFGGALDPGETPADAMHRELSEELDFAPLDLRPFTTLGMDFGFADRGVLPRHYFLATISDQDVAGMTQSEGQDMALVPGATALTMPRIIPYDAVAIWQHHTRHRF